MSKKILGEDIEAIIRESLQGLFEADDGGLGERHKQALAKQKKDDRKKAAKASKTGDDSDQMGDEAEDAGIEVQKKTVKVKHEKVPEINANKIADKINELRAGKSLKEKETMAALKTYFQKLNGPERIALYAFLNGLVKVLGDGTGDVKTPHSKPYSIDMEQEKPEQKSSSDKKPEGSKEPSASEKSENPIVVGESANKKKILKTLSANRRKR